MKKHPFVEYLKYLLKQFQITLTKKHTYQKEGYFIFLGFWVLAMLSWFLPIKFYLRQIIGFVIMLSGTAFIIIWAISLHYLAFKNKKLNTFSLPEDIKELEEIVGFDEAHYLKSLEERIKALECITPQKMVFWAIIVSVGIAIVLKILR